MRTVFIDWLIENNMQKAANRQLEVIKTINKADVIFTMRERQFSLRAKPRCSLKIYGLIKNRYFEIKHDSHIVYLTKELRKIYCNKKHILKSSKKWRESRIETRNYQQLKSMEFARRYGSGTTTHRSPCAVIAIENQETTVLANLANKESYYARITEAFRNTVNFEVKSASNTDKSDKTEV